MTRSEKHKRAKDILEIMDAPVGDVLDCLVAERVMGWERCRTSPGNIVSYKTRQLKMYAGDLVSGVHRLITSGHCASTFQPSSDGIHVQEAVVKCDLTTDEYEFVIERFGLSGTSCEKLCRACLFKVAGYIPSSQSRKESNREA